MTDLEWKQYVIDFVEGHVKAEAFMNRFQNDPALATWIQSVVPKNMVCNKMIPDEREWTGQRAVEIPYDVQYVLGQLVKKMNIAAQLNVHSEIENIMLAAFPEEQITPDASLLEQFSCMIDACPTYIGGEDADRLVSQFWLAIPEDISKTKKKKMLREKIKEAFHLDGKKYPFWLQPPEWPFSNGKPMKYLSQKQTSSDMKEYVFVDVDTGEQKIVVQFT